MTVQTRTTLKGYFETGDTPTQAQFIDLIDTTVIVTDIDTFAELDAIVADQTLVYAGGALGTPASGTLTNCTGLPIAGTTGYGTGVATFLATPTTANLLAAVTGETGTGALVFATSPTLVTPALGTPSSGTLTSCTGLPIAGITGLGAGVDAFLAAAFGQTGTGSVVYDNSPTLVTPALGTPSAGTLTSCTGYLGDSSLVTVGTIGTGTWQGTAVGDTYIASATTWNAKIANVVEDTTPQLGAALDGQGYDLNNIGVLFLTEQAAAEVDVAGKGQFWVQTATPNIAMFTDDAGTDFQLATLTGTETLTNKTLDTPSMTGDLVMTERADHASTPGAGFGYLWTKNTAPSTLFFTDDAGTDTDLTASASGDALVANPLSQFAATTSLQLKGVISDETGSGLLVFATDPVLTTPNIGTPSAGTLTNCTGLPQAGTVGLTTADSPQFTGIELGHATDTTLTRVSAGVIAVEGTSVLLTGGALGTPSSGTLTSCTGLPISAGVSGLGTGVATFLGTPSSANFAAAITDETGTGSVVLGTSPHISHQYNAQTGTTYTLVADDQTAIVTMSNAASNTLTIPTNASVAFPVGTVIAVWQLGAGATTVAGDTSVTVNGVSAGTVAIGEQYGAATLEKIATDTWLVSSSVTESASDTVAGIVELATIAETNTGTDATRAVTPDGLDGWTGSAQIVTVGTVATGTWSAALAADTVDAITEIAAALKSGADTTLVTGTAGTNGNLASWNADGDAVDSSVVAANVLVSGGALGTPSSGTLTNATGLPQAGTVGLTTADSPQFTGIELGHATDTTLTRVSAGVIAVEGTNVLLSGGALGTPASGNLSNCTAYVGDSSLVTVGTIGTGTWQGTAVASAYMAQATDSAKGALEIATAAEVDTGTDNTRALTPDNFQASKRNLKWFAFNLVEAATDCATATNIAGDFVSPIAGVIQQSDTTPFYLYATNSTAGTTGTMVVDIHLNGTTIMTTNKLDFDTTEKTTTTAATPPDLTTTALAVGDIITIDIDSIHTTAAKGLTVYMAVLES